MYLKTIITSYFTRGICYGLQGDKVTVVSMHDEIAIVEAADKNRFPVPADNLSEQPVPKALKTTINKKI